MPTLATNMFRNSKLFHVHSSQGLCLVGDINISAVYLKPTYVPQDFTETIFVRNSTSANFSKTDNR